ncbi:MAG: response regulator transcription factor [Candidatus Melainabacteria bacterium]|jgi:DNA-binding response OmpR family regulator|nr:response regulator transcription factor [Candidatus Melainabacteria bacterium]
MAKILVVEDDSDLAEVLKITLSNKGHSVKVLSGGKDALDVLRVYKYDVIILDWMMPDVSGVDVLKNYREAGGKTPVLMLTAKTTIDDKEKALDLGADDYLTKPFHARELLARTRALLRRPQSMAQTILHAGDLELDPVSCTVVKAGKTLKLRPKVYSMLEFFMRHPNQVFSPETILERVWMDDSSASIDTVRTHIKLLRRSIDTADQESLIENVRNRGYLMRIAEPVN